jgi:hypothetical protein
MQVGRAIKVHQGDTLFISQESVFIAELLRALVDRASKVLRGGMSLMQARKNAFIATPQRMLVDRAVKVHQGDMFLAVE